MSRHTSSEDYDLAYALSLREEYNNNMVIRSDSALAEELQKKYTRESLTKVNKLRPEEIVDSHWELTDPNPDIHRLFVEYDSLFFGGRLVSSGVAVRWSNRMTLCAGVCSYEGRGRLCSIRLSQPLLKLRPRKNLVETLLHEMIHAYLFVTDNNKDHDGHGPEFLSHMHRINKASGTNISVYHSFHQEVNQYRQHWWKCNGPCQRRPPYYGMVRRAMNRPPSPRDPWWAEHQRTCGGKYEKVKEPENYGKKKTKDSQISNGCKDLRKMIKSKGESSGSGNPSTCSSNSKSDISFAGHAHESQNALKTTTHFTGHGFVLGTSTNSKNESKTTMRSKILQAVEKRKKDNSVVQPVRKYFKPSTVSDQADTTRTHIYIHEDSPSKQDNVAEESDSKQVSITKESASKQGSVTKESASKQGSVTKESASKQGSATEESASKQGSATEESISTQVNVKHNKIGNDDRIIISPDKHCSGSNEIEDVLLIDDEDLVKKDDLHESENRTDLDFRTCPVCGMANVPSAIINIHVSLCLDAEEEGLVVDD